VIPGTGGEEPANSTGLDGRQQAVEGSRLKALLKTLSIRGMSCWFEESRQGGASRPKPGSFGVFRGSRDAGEFDLSKEGTGYEHFR